MIRRLFLLLLLIGLLPAAPAGAHPLGMSLAEVTPGPESTRLALALAAEDVEVALEWPFFDREAVEVPAVRQAELADRLRAYLAERIMLFADGRHCPSGPAEVRTQGHVVQVWLDFPCGERAGPLELQTRLLAGQDPRYVQHVRIFRGDDMIDVVLRDGADRAALARPVDRLAVAQAYLLSGIEHILAGADHLAFLLGLLLWARRPLAIVKVVTAFTVAHAITLTLGALDLMRVPMRLVDPLVAATVIWVGIENFLSKAVDRRWKPALLLGLVHGLGFASVLQEYGLPREALALALIAFNLGIEVGQLVLVAFAMPSLWAIDRLWPHPPGVSGRPAVVVHALSAMLVVLGLWWLAERTVL